MERNLPSLISGETLRILLVSVVETVRDDVADLLAGRIGDYRLYYVAQPDLAPQRAADLIPHVILLDDALGATSVTSLIRQLIAQAPAAAIVVLVPADAMNLARDAVLAGARGFVPKPLEAEDLAATLRQVASRASAAPARAQAPEGPPGRILVFCAPKGGTGRTTLAINTSIGLLQATRSPVVLVDADYAAPAVDVALNLMGQRTIIDLLPRLARLDRELIAGVLTPHASGIALLLAPPPADLSHPISLPQVQQILVLLKRMYPWVIVDLGLPLDDTAFAFLDGADRIVMTVLPEMVGLRNTRLMLDQLHGRGYPDDRVWLILNRSTMRGGVPASDIEERLRVHIQYRIPDDQGLATHSVNRGIPIVVGHRNSAVGRAISGLAKQLAHEAVVESPASEKAPAQPPGGTRGRLFRRSRPAEPG
jgi:pilus assembly protein CpaE